jgi:hypothetical protein
MLHLILSFAMLVTGAVFGVAFACWRLRGDRTMTEALREVVPFLAGPRPRVPR